MEEMMSWRIPAFGNWEYYDGMPISHYLDSVCQACLIPTCFFGEEDLFKVPAAMPVKYAYPCDDYCCPKARKVSGVGEEKHNQKVQEQRIQGKACNTPEAPPSICRASMAVDEDLYKIPHELLYPKPKGKKLLRNLLLGCLGVVCMR